MTFLSCIGIALLVAGCGFLLSPFGWRGVPLLGVFGLLLLFRSAVSDVFPTLGAIFTAVPALSDCAGAALRIVGVCYLSTLAADVCHDLGSETGGKIALLAGRLEIFAVALPYFVEILSTGVSALSQY